MTTRAVARLAKPKAHPVVHVLGSGEAGAASHSRLVASLARGLDPERYRIAAVFLGESGPLLGELGASGVAVMRAPWQGGSREPAGALRFLRTLRALQPAIVHHHVGGLMLSEVTRLSTRAVVLAHVHAGRNELVGLDPSLAIVRGADAIVATCQAAVVSVRATARVIPPGIPVPAQQPALPRVGGPLVIGTAGRLAPLKGVEHLIRAMPAILRSVGDVVLEIPGEGSSEGELKAEVARLGLGDRVHFLGWLPDTGPWLERLDVYVQPSLAEGFSIATLEAIARARPVVATEVGGTAELVGPESGVLVAPGDDAALANAIVELLVDPKRRRALARSAWERAHDFSEAKMIHATEALYGELLDPPFARGRGFTGVASHLKRFTRGVVPDGSSHCIKRGYLRRFAPRQSEDIEVPVSECHPDVYSETASVARELGARRIIDIGCVAGARLMELAGEFDAIGLGYGANLQRARQAFPSARWIEHDLDSSDRLPLTEGELRGSVLLAADVIEHLRRPRRLLWALALALTDSSAAIISTPDRDLTCGIRHRGPPPNESHVREWNLGEFREFLRSVGLVNSHLRLTRSRESSSREHTILAVVLPAGVSPDAPGAQLAARAS